MSPGEAQRLAFLEKSVRSLEAERPNLGGRGMDGVGLRGGRSCFFCSFFLKDHKKNQGNFMGCIEVSEVTHDFPFFFQRVVCLGRRLSHFVTSERLPVFSSKWMSRALGLSGIK